MSVCMCVSHLYFFVGGIHFSYTEVGGTNIFHKKVGDKHFDTRGGQTFSAGDGCGDDDVDVDCEAHVLPCLRVLACTCACLCMLARVYGSYRCVYSQMSRKFCLIVQYYLISLNRKFHYLNVVPNQCRKQILLSPLMTPSK